VLNEAIGLQNRGHKVEIFCPTLSDDCFPELQEKVEVNELFWWIPRKSPCRNALGMFLTSIMAPMLLRQFKKFDVILAHSQPSNWLALQVKQSLKVPYVSYLHQTNRFLFPREVDLATGWLTDPDMEFLRKIHRLRTIIPRLDRISIQLSDYVLVNSEWIKLKTKICYGIDADVCYPGVDLSHFKNQVDIDEISRDPYILTTNRHYPQKGLHLLIELLSILVGEYPSLECVMTGSYTKYTRQLKGYAAKLGLTDNVVFTDNLKEDDLLALYKRAYVYTYTSPEEDFGLGPLEAGACGVPSIVWDYAGPRETVINGETGFRVKPYCIKEMSERHLRLLDDSSLRFKMGECASKFVQENFSWEAHIDALEPVLNLAAG
jgi:glycosyltransferase involved in cell wall biosynthesis